MFRLWCDYDYGQDYRIFTSEDAAKNWLWEAMIGIDGLDYMKSEGFYNREDIFDATLAGIEKLEVVG